MDIILLCETFLKNSNANLYNLPGYNFVYKCRSTKLRGGVGIYIKHNLSFIVRDDLSSFIEGEFESIFLVTTNMTKNVIIGEIYRPPNCNTPDALARYDEIFTTLKNHHNVIIGTDQNFDLLKIDTSPPSSDLIDSAFANGSYQLVPNLHASLITQLR